MQFDQITGQKQLKEQLLGFVNSGRIPHAQIFLGPPGCGKLALAIAFAQYVLCENKSGNESCGQCKACIKSKKLIHPDIHFSYPTVGSKMTSNSFSEEWREAVLEQPYMNVNQWLQAIGAENKQGNITVDECNNIVKKLSLKIFEGSHKILIMWLPEYLGKEGNRLLKLIEEPPENTLFILVAERLELILQTIRSRCQLVKVNPLSDEDVIAGLLKKQPEAESRVQSIAHLANGNFNEALGLLAQNENDQATRFLEWMRKCYKGNGVELVKWGESFAKAGRENQKQFVRYSLHFLREYLSLKMTGNNNIRLGSEEQKTAQNLTKVLSFEQVQKIAALLDDCYYHIERNANPKILFLDLSIKMNRILKNQVAVTR